MCCEKCGRENPDDKASTAQTGFDIAQAFAPGELGEGQTEKLIPAGEALHFVIATVTFHAATEFHQRKKIHHLSKNRSATVHAALPSQLRSGCRVAVNSNRFRSFSSPNPVFAVPYGLSRYQHWDSIDARSLISCSPVECSNRSLSSTAVPGCVESVLLIVFAFDAMCVSFEKRAS